MNEIQFGQFTLSTVVAVLMGAVLGAFPSFPDRFKNLVAMVFGGCLGILGLLCNSEPWVAKTIVIYAISGIMYGVQAIGTYNVLKKPVP
jgi:hypothetical protein